ncbi:hypothetical protein LWI28_019164 [Acer negundo]|uniref:Chlororespiratory reduction 2 n=1 Tax=Acer negundo TaxID=4023 RepID=A0AAD5P152_ACENE|nr:hypothetical protein LWI28_019164 [Acer negundo]
MKSNSLLKHKRLMCTTTNTRIPHLFTLLNQCSNIKHIHQTHAFIIFTGLDHDNLILTRFIDSCSSLRFSDYAFSVFTHHKPPPDIHLYNTMIKALSDSPSKAITLFNNIQATGLRPNNYSFPFALKAVVKLSAIEMGRQIHCQTIQTGLDLDLHVLTALIRMYASCARISDARKLFDGLRNRIKHVTLWNAMVAAYAKVGDLNNALALFESMTERNVISWTALISGYAQMDLPNEAITIFRKMQLQNVKPDEIAMLAALSACSRLGALELGVWIHNYINKHGLYTTVPLNNALIDMYAKSGKIGKALLVFENMKIKSVVTWTTMIAGLALHGLGREALDMFSRMEKARMKPNEITFIAILSACSHVGLVELGRYYFNIMKSRYEIEPRIEHYGCMIDLLSRAGYLQEAQQLLMKMPCEANAAIWGSLLAASNIYGDADLGECAMHHLIKLEPNNSGNYAILSNIYASLGRWKESGMLRKVMNDTGIKKMPGCSYVEVSNRVHEFIAGDMSHLDFDRIHQLQCKMIEQLKVAEHVQNGHFELFEFDER